VLDGLRLLVAQGAGRWMGQTTALEPIHRPAPVPRGKPSKELAALGCVQLFLFFHILLALNTMVLIKSYVSGSKFYHITESSNCYTQPYILFFSL
jgi:hypothetical protein